MKRCFRQIGPYVMAFFFAASPTVFAADNTDDAKTEEDDSQTFVFDEVVVTAPKMKEPLKVETDPRHPRQPVPAADGAGYLKNIPGFSMVRKGGTGGDPIFRGLGGSRLNIVMNGGYILGGCPSRMDPTTTYVFPETFSKITVLKGPESVEYGSSIAGSIMFERDTEPFTKPGTRLNTSLLFGSDNRRDQLLDVTQGDEKGYVRIIRTRNKAGDYKDGNGNYIHSAYKRDSTTGIIGFTPDKDTLLEFSIDTSSGRAAYADRNVDGTQFDRDSYNLRFEKRNIGSVLQNIKVNASRSTIDHIMDNYTLRPLKAGTMASSMEVKRTTTSGRISFDLALAKNSSAVLGMDYQKNEHSGNMIMGVKDYSAKPLSPDMTFTNYGIFADYKTYIDDNSRILSGIRFDDLAVKYAKYPGREDHDRTYAAFLRYEHDSVRMPVTSYVGIGHAERPADWWERRKTGGMSASPEKNTQLDTGWLYHKGKINANVSLFYSNVDDFILVTNEGNAVKNIDAVLYGGEADYTYKLSERWTAGAALAYTQGRNKTNDRPLPQIAPFEATFSLKSNIDDKWEAGILWRLVAAQKQYSVGEGNEIGTDIGPSGGFGILSLNASYKPNKNWTIAAGVDNLLNKNYAEFVSRGGVDISTLDMPATVRVNEPGRSFWLKVNYNF
ncbi:TonB-dependent copper receptor [Pectinatus haikarae]|uniref:TonB-dependent copper receptor n=1 Tax=Pectinatus haikarae TaxID=349096 RepID=UPI0018C60C3E|nr:TonB-dependent copper receptor [Pectinatus haikarae]